MRRMIGKNISSKLIEEVAQDAKEVEVMKSFCNVFAHCKCSIVCDCKKSQRTRYQSVHVLEHIWDGRDHPILKVRRSHFIPAGMEGVLVEILPHLTLAGFAGIGLRIDGKIVIAAVRGNKAQIVEDLLGIRPPTDAFMGSSLKLSWLNQHFTHVAMHNHNDVQLTRFARAYILRLIGDFMLTDHSSSRVPVRYLPLLEDFTITG
ncbi:uncharacterized protein LOC113859348 [Abrus precatorius]|uniref:Uncharacterized protein LOC113859348 n=1 Tax=Abrus precatorius TaxID=3816 RepID=A0A8B8KVQ5_ABRPR|nr:uncharacterized protein LOC113859348 [Abrus precatorius]